MVVRGSDITERFKILDEIGEGTFGKVLECWDRKKQERIAIKVVRNVPRYREGAEMEIDVLEKIMERSRTHFEWDHCCIRLLDHFDYYGHMCMSFGLFGPSLFDFIKKNKYQGFPPDMVKKMAFQLLSTVCWLHEFQLVHTDLKPENILLKHKGYDRDSKWGKVPQSADIVLIDFGNATFNYEHHTTIVSTRHYRAPEIILGVGWSYPCDIWSVGCILCELMSGDALFQTHENLEHLALMQKMLGDLPKGLVKEAKRGKKYFHGTDLLWPVNASSDDSIRAVEEGVPLDQQFADYPDFLSLIQGCLTYDVGERLTAYECLKHPYFEDLIMSNSYSRFIPPSVRKTLKRQKQGKTLITIEGSPNLNLDEGDDEDSC